MVQKPINKEFYEKTRAFVVSAVGFLLSCIERGEQIPSRIVERKKMGGRGAYMIGSISLPLYSIFIDRHRKEIEELPEFEHLHNLMSSDTTISKHLNKIVGTCDELTQSIVWIYLNYFLCKQLSQLTEKQLIEKLEFDPETFDNMYFDLEQFFYSNSVDLRVFSPLHNFSSDVGEIDLGSDLRIRRITTSELEEILNQTTFSQMQYMDITSLEYKMELTYQTEKVIREKPTSEALQLGVDVNEIFNKLVAALRLFKSGIVGFNITKKTPMLDIQSIIRERLICRDYKVLFGSQYTLIETEVSEFRSFWDRFNKINLKQLPPLSMAIRRFNYAYDRDRLKDKLVDYMIAFEALFFKQGEMSELSHRLAVRVSRLLKQNYNEREDIMKEMKKFYKKRSQVVHGEDVDLDADFVNKVEGYLRESLRLFLERLQSLHHDKMISILDLGES